jgi:aquaporin Z
MSTATPEPVPSTILLSDDPRDVPRPAGLLARTAAEALGTFVVLLVGLGTFLLSSYSGAGTLGVALAFGLGTIAAMAVAAPVSGGHLNPAITLGSAVAGRTRWSHVLPYWLAQVVGAAAASSVVFVVLSSFAPFEGTERTQFTALANGFDLYTPLVRTTDAASAMSGLGLTGALVLEGVLTAVLVGAVLAVTVRAATDRAHAALVPVVGGLTLTAAMLVAIPLTNGGLNPARSLAAALYSDSWVWGQLWVFVVAPLAGALLAGLLGRAFAVPVAGRVADAEDEDLDGVDLLDLDGTDVLVEEVVTVEVATPSTVTDVAEDAVTTEAGTPAHPATTAERATTVEPATTAGPAQSAAAAKTTGAAKTAGSATTAAPAKPARAAKAARPTQAAASPQAAAAAEPTEQKPADPQD